MTSAPEKRALITGTSQGLGKALSDLLLVDGWNIVAVDRQHGRQEENPLAERVTADLSDRKSVDELLDQLKGQAGFDLVIFNAAVSATGKFEKIPLEAHFKLLQLNAESPMVMTASLAAMGKLNGNARIGFISSLSHFTGYPGAASYAASKDAIAIYARSIRKPFAKMGVKVSCVFPGPMRTDHAERHAPMDANADKRMPPEAAAPIILTGFAKGKARIIPGSGPTTFAWLGRVVPFLTDRAMRKIIYEKLDREVY